MVSLYSYKVYDINMKLINMELYKNKVLLIVNVASKCGFTNQYSELEELYSKYFSKGLTILGFPCNQFKHQEPGSNAEIKQFCDLNYNIKFPLFSKIDVNGVNEHPLYKFLKDQKRGFLRTKKIKWNFTKFLVNRNGEVVKRYAPFTKPLKLKKDIEVLL